MSKKVSVIVSATTAAAARKVKSFALGLKKDLGGAATYAGGKLASMAKLGAVTALAGVVAVSALAAKNVVMLGASMEQTRVAFQTMVGDVDKGNAVLAKLNKFANYTPFNNKQVIQAGRTLMSFGTKAEHIADVLRMVGDVSAGSGKDFNELAMIFGKVQAKGKAQAEELNQMSEAGIPIIKTLAAMYGKTGEEIYQMASAGQLTSGVITAAFRKMTDEGGMYHNMMQKQSETVGGQWSTIVGNLQLIGSEIGESLLPLMKAGTGVLGQWVEKLQEMNRSGKIIEILSTIGLTGISVVASLIKAFNTFSGYFQAIWSTLGRVGRIVMNSLLVSVTVAFNGIVKTVVGAVNAIINALNQIKGVNLGKVDASGLTDALDIIKTSAAAEIRQDAFAIGKDYTDAANETAQKNAAVDKQAAEWSEKVAKWQQKSLDIRHKMNKAANEIKDEKFVASTSSTPLAKKSKKASMSDAVAVDSLTRIGLYNAGAGSTRNYDQERNKLLKELVRITKRNNQVAAF